MKLSRGFILCFILIPCLAIENYWRPATFEGTGQNALNFTLNTLELVSQGKMNPDCSDLRIHENGAWLFEFTAPEKSVVSLPFEGKDKVAVHDGISRLPYWIGSGKIYTKINSTRKIHITASDESDPAPRDVFIHFDDSGDLSLYDNLSGIWVNESGRIKSESTAPGETFGLLMTNHTAENFYAEGEFEINDSLSSVGFVFRFGDEFNFYMSFLSAYEDKLAVFKYESGIKQQLNTKTLSINTNTIYHHNITAKENSFELCIWENLENLSCVSASDSSFSSGKFGLQADYKNVYADNILMHNLTEISNVSQSEYVFSSSGRELPYWIESGCNTEYTSVWFMTPYAQSGKNTTVFIHYGNASRKYAGNETAFSGLNSSFSQVWPGPEFLFSTTLQSLPEILYVNRSTEFLASDECNISTDAGTFPGTLNVQSCINRTYIHSLNISGNLTIQESWIENVTVNASSSGLCINYSFSAPTDTKYYLKPPAYDPKAMHATGTSGNLAFSGRGTFSNGSWWIAYNGNKTEFSACIASGKEPDFHWCGDGECTENCNSCQEDCGRCKLSGSGISVQTPAKNTALLDEANKNATVEVNESLSYEEELKKLEAEKNLLRFFSEYSGSLSSDGTTVNVASPSRVSIIGGIALTDGKRIFSGELVLPEGNYTVFETNLMTFRLGWTMPGIAGLGLVLGAFLLARRSKPF
jgi:hypothetical protein